MVDFGMIRLQPQKNATSAMKPHGESHYLIFVQGLAVLNDQNSTAALFPYKKRKSLFV